MVRTTYIVSDLHISQGRNPDGTWNVLEDFRVDDEFCAFLDHIGASSEPVELVIAGDFIEYLQILPELGLQSPQDHLGVTEAQSLERTRVVLGQRPDIASGHPQIFDHLRRFMERGHSITLLAGNHDVDVLWSSVWATIANAICPDMVSGTLRLEPFSYTIGTAEQGCVYVEHGHEHDRANAFGDQMQDPFAVDINGVKRLKRPWGTLFVDKVFNQLEQQRWFIDNVKPISRVIKLGLKGNFLFTASAMAVIARFFLANNPLWGVSFGVMGGTEESMPTDRSAEAVVTQIDDPEVRATIEQAIQDDPAFREEFERELQNFTQTEQYAMQQMQADVAEQPFDEEKPSPESVSFSVGAGEPEDEYRKAARKVMEDNPAISTVVMGHTHFAIDGLVEPIHIGEGRTGYYFNSGTWTPRLREHPGSGYTWDDLDQHDNYASSLDYLRCVPNERGEYHVELHSWRAERPA
jgi:UDP-2,3-diacylglucosamine pyrophosphatase LpxH